MQLATDVCHLALGVTSVCVVKIVAGNISSEGGRLGRLPGEGTRRAGDGVSGHHVGPSGASLG